MGFYPAGNRFILFLLDPGPGKLPGLDVSTRGSPGTVGEWGSGCVAPGAAGEGSRMLAEA